MFCIAICDDKEYFCIKEKELVAGFMDCKGYPYRIDIFSSGRELLDSPDLISQYDVIFLDVNMRELDGIETAKEIRKITRETYIVFVTAFITYAPEGYNQYAENLAYQAEKLGFKKDGEDTEWSKVSDEILTGTASGMFIIDFSKITDLSILMENI